MLIVPLAPDHAAAAAGLHIAGQPGTFLTGLGAEVLAILYELLPVSSAGFGFAALAERSAPVGAPLAQSARPASSGDEVIGFVSATTGTGSLFFELGTRRLGRLLPPLLRAYGRRPQLVWRSIETVIYPMLAGGQAAHRGEQEAELLSIMVAPGRRGQGVGSLLLAALGQHCLARGISQLAVTVAAANEGAQRFYRRHGFQAVRNFSLYGRPMCGYRLAVEQEIGRWQLAATTEPTPSSSTTRRGSA